MQFLEDIIITCEACEGKRFKPEVLKIQYRDRNISEVLDMTVNEALVRQAGWKNPIGKSLDIWWMKNEQAQYGTIDGAKDQTVGTFENPNHVLGVIRDFISTPYIRRSSRPCCCGARAN
jgi:hypothetical protein